MEMILKTALVLGVLSGSLAILLTYSKKLLEETALVTIRINRCEDIPVATNQSLLDALGFEGVSIPAKCGGKGTCGDCVVKFDFPIPEANVFDRNCIGEDRLAQGYRLSCRHEMTKDINIFLPEDQIGQWLPCQIKAVESLSKNLFEISLIYDQAKAFIPGQRIRIKMSKPHGEGNCVKSFYLSYREKGDPTTGFAFHEEDYPDVISVLRDYVNVTNPLTIESPINDLKENQLVICDRSTIGLYLALKPSQQRKIIMLESKMAIEGLEAAETYVLPVESMDDLIHQLVKDGKLTKTDAIYLTGHGAWVSSFKKGLLRLGIPVNRIETIEFNH